MSIAAERGFAWERGERREHIPHRSATDEQQSSQAKDPQPVWVEAKRARRLRCSSLTAPRGDARSSRHVGGLFWLQRRYSEVFNGLLGPAVLLALALSLKAADLHVGDGVHVAKDIRAVGGNEVDL